LVYSGHTFTDCGNANDAVDPGETIDLSVTVQNTGSADAFNVNGTLSTVTPDITIAPNTATFPDIPVGLTGTSLTPFQFVVDLSVPCGTFIDFSLDLTYEDSAGDPFSNAVSFQVQVSAAVPVTFLSEDFSAGLPGTWTVVNGGNGPDTWTDSVTSVLNGCPDRGLFPDTHMIVDGDCAGSGAFQDEYLITPLMDTSTASVVTLQLDHDFKGYATDALNDDFATIRVRSANTGGAWATLIQWDETQSNAGPITFDATAECAGAADCQFGWRYEGNWDWYWGVDNVMVDGIAGCNPAVCCSALDPAVIAIVPTPACAGDTITFTAQAATGGVPPYTYWWDFGDGDTSMLQNPTHTYAEAGAYTVRLQVEDSCFVPQVQEATDTVTVNALPTPVIVETCGDPNSRAQRLRAGPATEQRRRRSRCRAVRWKPTR
jgi:uncharacterized repeat protein (TIGR01451 family)